MTETELLDKTFMFLYTMDDEYIFPSAFEKRVDIGKANPIMLLNTIHDIGFAGKEKNTQQSLGASQTIHNYWINSDGTNFIKRLPADFSQRPYTYYRQQKDADTNLSLEKANLEIIDLRNKVFDYDETKIRSKNAIRWSAGATVAAVLMLMLQMLQWKCSKPD
ncbi:hypothetical protein [Terrimonas pollutisoli]|uniref:hypothetical protein n=1 Tax=Terrimonas pollutisoli TaxID=3034147 RepID=UPI0023EDE981|nr:hypothetical protein [Terrimonas sp. H1YJ31]